MVDLFKGLAENKRSAMFSLKAIKDNTIVFDIDIIPFVLLCNDDGEINDMAVSSARITNDTIEIYITDNDEWINVDDCLSTTANNVYEAIQTQLFD